MEVIIFIKNKSLIIRATDEFVEAIITKIQAKGYSTNVTKKFDVFNVTVSRL